MIVAVPAYVKRGKRGWGFRRQRAEAGLRAAGFGPGDDLHIIVFRWAGRMTTKEDLEGLFTELADLARADERILGIAVYGGTALILSYPARPDTKDVGALFSDDAKWLRDTAAIISDCHRVNIDDIDATSARFASPRALWGSYLASRMPRRAAPTSVVLQGLLRTVGRGRPGRQVRRVRRRLASGACGPWFAFREGGCGGR